MLVVADVHVAGKLCIKWTNLETPISEYLRKGFKG